jgi:hypothetical protein
MNCGFRGEDDFHPLLAVTDSGGGGFLWYATARSAGPKEGVMLDCLSLSL